MSTSESENEFDTADKYIPYSHRPEWSDVEPIEQDDGPYAVVKIAYTNMFRETFDYLRACMKSDEMSERALELTHSACQLNPANYTVWCYRRKLLFHLQSDLKEELTFLDELIMNNPKNYQVWEHRRLIVERSGYISNELKFISDIIHLDSKNYHAWQYRQWLLKTYSLWSDELNYINQLLDNDIKNNSAWNQRYFVISHTTGFTDDVTERELEYVEKRILAYPDNESTWNYLRGIARFRSTNSEDQRVWKYCQNLYDNHFLNDDLNKRQWRFLLAYMVDLLNDDETNVDPSEKQNRIGELCDKLANDVDPIRKQYWNYIREQYVRSKC